MLNRRHFFRITLGAGATLALTPDLLRALQSSGGKTAPPAAAKLMQRAIPSSGEMLPVISFGARVAEAAAIKEVLKALLDNGGKVVDVLHGGPAGERAARSAALDLGLQDKFFWTTPLSASVPTLIGYDGPPLKPGAADVKAAIEAKFAAFKVKKIDLVMVGSNADIPTHLGVLREMKKAGRVRYIGVHHLAFPADAPIPPFGELEAIMHDEPIDFVGTDYSVGDRRVEEKILPLCQEKKIAFMAYFPFDRRRIFERASSTPLPEWAAEFDAKTWAQFFLKYVLSHPAVIVARTGTTNAAHMIENIGGGIGRLPNEAMRKRMAELVDALPPTPPYKPKPQPPAPKVTAVAVPTAVLDRYVGKYAHAAVGTIVTIRRDGDKLLVKVSGNMPEGPLVARSETLFVAPWPESTIEFEVDAKGKVTGAVVEQFDGAQRIPLEKRT
jgi:aryl-alcohol dehydrogenase-like predicted oxidoreductase